MNPPARQRIMSTAVMVVAKLPRRELGDHERGCPGTLRVRNGAFTEPLR